jgi:hypothetical protein
VEADSLHQVGGNRRIDRVLSPEFVRDLGGLPIADLRQRRDEALAEREYLSLLRRLVHGRLDIIRAERARRSEGSTGSLIDRLSEVLSEEERGGSRGEAVRIAVPEEEIALARRRIERLVSDASISNPPGLSEEELSRSERRLTDEERMVSRARAAVMHVHDELQDELKRRFKQDLSQITTS